jgi:hypothetical protein
MLYNHNSCLLEQGLLMKKATEGKTTFLLGLVYVFVIQKDSKIKAPTAYT